LSDYSKVAAALQKRRTDKKLHVPSESGIADHSAVRAYRPEEGLAERGEKTRELVEDAAGIPRSWEPEWTPSTPRNETWILHTALWASVAGQGLVYVAADNLNLVWDIILLSLAAGAAIALVVCAIRNLLRNPVFGVISLAIGCFELLVVVIMYAVCIRWNAN
jgi:hypothetical protein